jgi:peptidoglycan/LPS O-acetylase OafA/YrhL
MAGRSRVAPEEREHDNSRTMANLTANAPVEPEKSTSLHERDNRPKAPAASRLEFGKRWAWPAVGVLLALGFVAVLFSVRDSWDNHREWLVTTIPFLVMAGIGLAYVLARGKVVPLAVGGTFLFLALVFAGADLLADQDDAATDTTRDVLSILAGVCLGIAVAGIVFALVWVEAREPTKAPTLEA